MSHYISAAQAKKADELAIRKMIEMDPEGLLKTVKEKRHIDVRVRAGRGSALGGEKARRHGDHACPLRDFRRRYRRQQRSCGLRGIDSTLNDIISPMKEIFISTLLTLVLGPGVGHLYLKSFKKAAMLILTMFGLFALLLWRFLSSIDSATRSALMSITEQEVMSQKLTALFHEFTISNQRFLFYYYLAIAAIWSYAFVDGYVTARAMMPPPAENENPPDDN